MKEHLKEWALNRIIHQEAELISSNTDNKYMEGRWKRNYMMSNKWECLICLNQNMEIEVQQLAFKII